MVTGAGAAVAAAAWVRFDGDAQRFVDVDRQLTMHVGIGADQRAPWIWTTRSRGRKPGDARAAVEAGMMGKSRSSEVE